MIKLKIDPEFQSLIPPLTKEEFKQLRDNILEAGEVLDPIKTWQGSIVDGHNRWSIIQDNPDIPFKTYEMIFLSRDDAKLWIIDNQIGRRNLSKEQQSNLRGKRYELEKKREGGSGNNQYTKEELPKNCEVAQSPQSTAQRLAKEYGVSKGTIENDAKFSRGIDKISEISKEAAERVLRGGSTITKAQVMDIPKMEEPDVEAIVETIMNPPPKPQKSESPAYTIQTLQAEIRSSGENYVRFLRETLAKRNTVYAGSSEAKLSISDEIEHICNAIRNIQNILN